ncbi:MAG: sigma-E factor regulatory protein RseB domain-containing protein, partial [Rhodanobacteraceae bacterium]
MRVVVRCTLVLLFAFLIFPAALAWSGAVKGLTPEAWLARADGAMRTLNYAGTFVYIYGDTVSTMQITHRGDAAGGVERLISLSGPRHEVIRDHKNVESVFPDSRRVLMQQRGDDAHFPATLAGHINATRLAGNYVLKELGKGRVAGLQCEVISLSPRDQYRYGYTLWLDERTGMLLRSDLLDETGKVVARVMFTALRYPAHIPDSALKATEIGAGFAWIRQGDREKLAPDETGVRW